MAKPGFSTHPKFRRLQRELGLAKAPAWGHMECLWEPAYQTGNAIIGDATDVEIAADWHGEPGKLCDALLRCKFIEETGDGRYQIHDLHANAPQYVRDRWERELLRTEERTCVTCGEPFRSGEPHAKFCSPACKQRDYRKRNAGASRKSDESPRDVTQCDAGETKGVTRVTERYEPPSPAQPVSNTSASASRSRSAKPKADTNPNHAPAVTYFCDRWQELAGKPYPFKAKDAAHIRDILKACGNRLDDFRAIVDRYFRNRDKFYVGHLLGKLVNDLPKFLTDHKPSVYANGHTKRPGLGAIANGAQDS